MTPTQNWMPIPGFPNYEISQTGQVKNLTTGKTRPGTLHDGGYRRVWLVKDGVKHRDYIHRLVLLAHVGPPTGPVVRHMDGNPANNYVGNLQWGTVSENGYDRVRHGTYRNGNEDKTHCPQGHPYDDENTYVSKAGKRACKECERKRNREKMRRYRAEGRPRAIDLRKSHAAKPKAA
jgi:hypothetical protein